MMIHDISGDIAKARPYPGDPKTEINRVKSINTYDGYNLSELYLSAHISTHIDAPLHFVRGGKDVSELDLLYFYGECTVVTLQGVITGEDMDRLLPLCKKRLLIRGEGQAYISSSAVDSLADNGIVLVGTDADSIGADFEIGKVHYGLLNRDIVILENLKLKEIKDGNYVLCAFPLKISGCEASPCRAVLIEGEKLFWF